MVFRRFGTKKNSASDMPHGPLRSVTVRYGTPNGTLRYVYGTLRYAGMHAPWLHEKIHPKTVELSACHKNMCVCVLFGRHAVGACRSVMCGVATKKMQHAPKRGAHRFFSELGEKIVKHTHTILRNFFQKTAVLTFSFAALYSCSTHTTVRLQHAECIKTGFLYGQKHCGPKK